MTLNLDVSIDQDSGFCFGVVYAIDMAEEILRGGARDLMGVELALKMPDFPAGIVLFAELIVGRIAEGVAD